MYNEKLSQLADFLAYEVKDVGFWLGFWFSSFDEQKACNTVACAFGWAPMCFGKESGLSIQTDEDGSPDVAYGRHIGLPAARKFFGITDDQARYLFIPGETHYKDDTPRLEVAKRIKQFAIDGRVRS